MASKQPSKKQPTPPAKKDVKPFNAGRAMTALKSAAMKTSQDPFSYVKPGMGPVGKIAASKTMPSKKAATKKK